MLGVQVGRGGASPQLKTILHIAIAEIFSKRTLVLAYQ